MTAPSAPSGSRPRPRANWALNAVLAGILLWCAARRGRQRRHRRRRRRPRADPAAAAAAAADDRALTPPPPPRRRLTLLTVSRSKLATSVATPAPARDAAAAAAATEAVVAAALAAADAARADAAPAAQHALASADTSAGERLPGAALEAWRFNATTPFLDAVRSCRSLRCLRDAHLQPRGGAKFNFPHFMIAGWSKSATTSVYQYLNDHPQVLSPTQKEPMLLTDRCTYPGGAMSCPPERVREYIQHILKVHAFADSGGALAAYEATPRIMDAGPELAKHLAQLMPWVKLVALLREPVSRAMSKYVHHATDDKFQNKGCMGRHAIDWCLVHDEAQTYGNPRDRYYFKPIAEYLDYFPPSQLLFVQYEELVAEATQARELRRIKEFIGVDVAGLPDALEKERAVCRHCTIQPQGWPMAEADYRGVLKLVEKDAARTTAVLEAAGLANGTRWMENWRAHWARNLATCVGGNCTIALT